VRLTVTPIGAAGASAAGVSAAVVNYLEGERGDPGAALLGVDQAADYYADSREGPGRWLGQGAAFQGLRGVVNRDSFQRVLDGRHPITGARLVTAQGSSQRRHLAAGTAAQFDADGAPMYDVSDAARLLGLRRRDVEEMIEAGRDGSADPADPRWLGSVYGADGPLVPDREISRHLEFAAVPVTAADVLGDGDVNEMLSVAQVARLLAVTPQYVRRLCDEGSRGKRDGRQVRASLPSERAGDGPMAPYLIRRGDVADFAEQRRPPIARVGYDVTLTCEKSLGLLAMLSDGERQQNVVNALRAANETAMSHLDRVAAVARKGGQAVGTEGLIIASYFHGTSRALDPHPHHHNVVANAVVDEDGDVRTLDARALYRHAPAAAALATAALRWELRELGLGWWRRDDGVWEVAGIDERAIREFSRRRNEMDEVRAVLEERFGRPITHDEENTVALSTRPAKDAVDATELVADWRRRAKAVGLDVDGCFDRPFDRAVTHALLPGRDTHRLFEDLADPVSGLCAMSNTFDRADVLKAIADWAITDGHGRTCKVLLPPQEIERLADVFCGSAQVVQLDPVAVAGVIRRRDGTTVSDGQRDPVYTTMELLEVESEIIACYRNGRHAAAGCVTCDHLGDGEGTTDAIHLSDEQRALVRSWCTSGYRVQAAVGRAGTGKTTTMRAAAHAWRAAGYRVTGCAVKAEAARQLAGDAGIEADTVALLLARATGGQLVLDRDTILIVDEASTIGDRDLLAILRLADGAGATVRLIGDTAQHGSVPAGGSFAQLVELGGDDTPELTEVRRLRDPAQCRRSELVRSGQIIRALDELQESGQLVLTDSDAETYAAMLDRWYVHRRSGDDHPMVHGRNRQRRLLNQIAQAVLAADGTVDLEHAVTLSDGRRLCLGDDVIARHGDRSVHPDSDGSAWMRNGTTGRIIAVHRGGVPADDRVTVRTSVGPIEVRRAVFDRRRGGLDLGYAVTSYAVQGSTRNASTSAVTATTARSELYVDITRGRDSNQLYATRRAADRDGEEHLPRLDRELVPTLQHRLARGTVRTALAIDPDALAVGQARRGRDLLGLLAAHRRVEIGALDQAIDRAIAAVRRQAQSAPPGALKAVLPARPRCPHLAARWDLAAGDVAVRRASTSPARRQAPPVTPMERALGHRPDDEAGRQLWNDLASQLATLAVDITLSGLRRQSATGRDSTVNAAWLRPYLERLGGAGRLASVVPPQLGEVIEAVESWRSVHSIDPADTTTVLGPRPSDPAERMQFDRLARQLELRDENRRGRSVA